MEDKVANLPKSSLIDFIDNPNESQSTEPSEDDNRAMVFDKDRRKAIIPRSHLPQAHDPPVNVNNSQINPDHSTSRIEQDDDPSDSFDTFILNHFSPFSGAEDVIKWLNEVEQKFNQHRISRALRFAAIPLLVVDEAKRKYIKKRNQIASFEDFYEFLLTTFERTVTFSFDSTTNNRYSSKSNQNLHDRRNSNSNNDKFMYNTFDNSEVLSKPPILRSTALIDLEDTTITCNNPMSTHSLVDNITSSVFDHTTNDIRKAILDSFVKTPKTFQGGNEDVIKWLEELEHLFEIGQIPDQNKLALISYALRGDALDWYKTTKSTIKTWSDFVKEIKQAYSVPYEQEFAFQKLETYNQASTQSVRNYYNALMKLCQEADSTMTETTKVKYLLGKAKPTIQFEVRRRNPTTTSQFLLYAKEIEALYKLSNLNVNQQPTLNPVNPVPVIDNKSNNSNNQHHPSSSTIPTQARTNFNYSYPSPQYRPPEYNNTYNQRHYDSRYTSQPRTNRQSFQPRGYYNNNNQPNSRKKSFNPKSRQSAYHSNDRNNRSNEPIIPRSQAAIHNAPYIDQSVQFDPALQSSSYDDPAAHFDPLLQSSSYDDQTAHFDPSLQSSSCEDQPPLNPSLSTTAPHFHF